MAETHIYQLNLNEDELAILGAVMLMTSMDPQMQVRGVRAVEQNYPEVLKLMLKVSALVKETPVLQKFMKEHPEVLGESNVS